MCVPVCERDRDRESETERESRLRTSGTGHKTESLSDIRERKRECINGWEGVQVKTDYL